MKRRVLRQHVNKKALRTLQAVHRIKEPFHILLDETFLRSIVEPLRSSHDGEKRVTLHQLFADAFGSCVLNVLPETLHALERHQHVAAVELASRTCQVAPASSVATSTAAGVAVATDAPPVGQQHRNEHKAIVAAVSSAHHSKRFFFVATHSHDLKRQLPTGSCGLVRASFQPLALWIEECHGGDGDRDSARESGGGTVADHRHRLKPNLSPADTAFMKSVGIDPQQHAARSGRKRQRPPVSAPVPPSAQPSVPSGAPPTPTPNDSNERNGSGKRETFSRRRIKGPNPLSVKKRSTRETLCVVDDDEPPRHKRRSEQ